MFQHSCCLSADCQSVSDESISYRMRELIEWLEIVNENHPFPSMVIRVRNTTCHNQPRTTGPQLKQIHISIILSRLVTYLKNTHYNHSLVRIFRIIFLPGLTSRLRLCGGPKTLSPAVYWEDEEWPIAGFTQVSWIHHAVSPHGSFQPKWERRQIWAIPWKWSAEYKKINFCNNYVTDITGKLIICTLLCKSNYMVIYIRIDFVDIWIQARTWMLLEKKLLPNSSEVVRVK